MQNTGIGFYLVVGPTLFVTLIFTYFFYVACRRLKKLFNEGNSYVIGKWFYGTIAFACLCRMTGFTCVIGFAIYDGGFNSDDKRSTYTKYLIIFYFFDFIFVSAGVFLIWRFCILFFTSHLSNWKINVDSDLPFFLQKKYEILRYALVFIYFSLGIIFSTLLYNQSISPEAFISIVAGVEYTMPTLMISYEIYLHIKFSGLPYKSAFLSSQCKLINRIMILWFVSRLLLGLFLNITISYHETTFDEIIFENDLPLWEMFLIIGIQAVFIVFAELVPFHQALDMEFARIFFKLDDAEAINESNDPFMVEYMEETGNKGNILNKCEINSIALTEKKFSRPNGLGEIFVGNLDNNENMKVAVRKLFIPRIKNYLLDEISRDIQMYIYMQEANKNILQFKGINYKGSHDLLLVFEHIDAGPISKCLHTKHFPFEAKLRILIKASNTLNFLHSQSPPLIHGHFSTDNLFVLPNEEVRISEILFTNLKKFWGLREGYCNKGRQTAPELWEEKSRWVSNCNDPTIDVYSFGIVIWEVFSEQIAFDGMTSDEIKEKIQVELLRPKIPDFIPTKISTLIQACWQQDPIKRPSIINVRKSLEQALISHQK